ncbi:MAG: ABC transporter permease [Ruminococcaceae bacterium]|nr:ABC transporter permease [Oscillospiraceae bacterium]
MVKAMLRKIFTNTLKSCLRNTLLLTAVLGSIIMMWNVIYHFIEITGIEGMDKLAEARNLVGYNAAEFPYKAIMFFFCGLVISWDCVADFTTNNAELMASSGLRTGRWFLGKLLAYGVLCFAVSLTASTVTAVFRTMWNTEFTFGELFDLETIFRMLLLCLVLGFAGFLTYSGLAIFFSQLFRKPAAGLVACTAYHLLVNLFIKFDIYPEFFLDFRWIYLPQETRFYFYGFPGDSIAAVLSFKPIYTIPGAWSGYFNICFVGIALLFGGYLLARKRFRKFN